jgi:ribonuclease P protein component
VIARKGLSKSSRLHESAAFSAVFKAGCRSRDRFFAVYATPNHKTVGRLGLAVSRKVSPKAVTRNTIKRQIREAFRKHQHALTGLDIVVVAQSAAARQRVSSLQLALERHWQKIIKT